MKKILLVISAMSIFLTLFTGSAYAGTYPAGTCKKVGVSVVYLSKKYTCIKSGKVLIWDRGKLLKNPIRSQVQTSGQVANSAALANESSPAPPLPTSFDDLLTHLAGIPYSAWRKASDRIQQNTFAVDNLYFFIGPKTNLNEQDSHYKSAINSVTKLFAKVPQSKHVYLIYYGKDDIDWAQMQFEKYMDANYGYGNKSTAASNNCNPPHCEGGMAVHTANFDSIILMGDNDGWAFSNFNPNSGYKGHTFAHEYTHTIQLTNMNPNWGGFPRWLAEGIAEWSATVSVFAGDYEGFMNFRNHADLGSQFGSPATYNYAYFEKFLNPSMTFEAGENINTFYSKYPHWDSYAIGMMVAEILVSIKDPESLIEVFKKINSGLAFPDAFQAEYGISWSEAAPKIARAISAQIEKGAK